MVAIPGNPVHFAKHLKDVPLFKDQLLPFVNSLKVLDQDLLAGSLESIADLLERDTSIAAALEPRLNELREEFSLWECHVYLANYGETAMLVLPRGKLEVKRQLLDRPVREDCHLVVYGKDSDGDVFVRDEKNGLLVAPGGQESFIFMTTQEQRDMESGHEMRGRFKDASCKARITFEYVSAGIPARKTGKTPWRAFTSE